MPVPSCSPSDDSEQHHAKLQCFQSFRPLGLVTLTNTIRLTHPGAQLPFLPGWLWLYCRLQLHSPSSAFSDLVYVSTLKPSS